MHRVISKKVFQAIVLLLLPLSIALAGYWFLTDRGVYHLIAAIKEDSMAWRGLSLLLTVLVNLIGVAVVAAILRGFTHDMPTLRSQLQNDVDAFKTPGTVREKMQAAMQQQGEYQTIPQAAVGGRIMAVVMVSLGLAFGLVGIGSLLMSEGTIYQFQLTLLLLALGLFIWGVVNLVRGRGT